MDIYRDGHRDEQGERGNAKETGVQDPDCAVAGLKSQPEQKRTIQALGGIGSPNPYQST